MAKKQQTVRTYREAQLKVEAVPSGPGEFAKLVHMRFATYDNDGRKETPGTTPWVVFNPATIESLAMQLASVAESIKAWTPGETAEVSGSNIGIVKLDKPHDG